MKFLVCYNDHPDQMYHKTVRITTPPLSWKKSNTTNYEILKKFVKKYIQHPNHILDINNVHLATMESFDHYIPLPSDIPTANCISSTCDDHSIIYVRHGKSKTQTEMMMEMKDGYKKKNHNNIESTTEEVAGDNANNNNNVIPKIRHCARYGCMNEYPLTCLPTNTNDDNTNDENGQNNKAIMIHHNDGSTTKFGPCLYHKSPPVFRTNEMYWMCCPTKKVTRFTELLKVRGCQTSEYCTLNEQLFISEVVNTPTNNTTPNNITAPSNTAVGNNNNMTPTSILPTSMDDNNNRDNTPKVTSSSNNVGEVYKNQIKQQMTNQKTITRRYTPFINDNKNSTSTTSPMGNNSTKLDESRNDHEDDDSVRNKIQRIDKDRNNDRDSNHISMRTDNILRETATFITAQDNKTKSTTRDNTKSNTADSSMLQQIAEDGDTEIDPSIPLQPSLIKFKKVLRSFGVDSILYNDVIDDMKKDYEALEMDGDKLDLTVKNKLGSMLRASFQAVAKTAKIKQTNKDNQEMTESNSDNDGDDDSILIKVEKQGQNRTINHPMHHQRRSSSRFFDKILASSSSSNKKQQQINNIIYDDEKDYNNCSFICGQPISNHGTATKSVEYNKTINRGGDDGILNNASLTNVVSDFESLAVQPVYKQNPYNFWNIISDGYSGGNGNTFSQRVIESVNTTSTQLRKQFTLCGACCATTTTE